MNRWFLFLLTTGWIISSAEKSNAQLVTIPDAPFVMWLQANGYAGCMTGNQLDTTCFQITAATTVDCSNSNISDLTGIQYFDNLDSLKCIGNELISLPTLPIGLTYLNSKSNPLTSMPQLPPGLLTLICQSNLIDSLPDLPQNLIELNCYGNSLSTLPELPATLQVLECKFNDLVSLPTLPSALKVLHFSVNQVDSLPPLPSSLESMYCSSNPLGVIPTLPQNLQSLECISNDLSSLPALPQALTFLDCRFNELSQLPLLPVGLAYLFCSDNELSSLPPLPSALIEINCANNLLTDLPSLPFSLNRFHIDNNTGLLCMPPLQKFAGTPSKFTIVGTGIQCLPNVIQHPSYPYIPAIDTMPVCGIINANGCEVGWNILGTVFHDVNLDCLPSNEPGLGLVKVSLLNNGVIEQQLFTSNGLVTFQQPIDTYTLAIDTNGLPFNVYCPPSNSYPAILTVANPIDTAATFGLTCKPGYDASVEHILHTSVFFPGVSTKVSIYSGEVAQYFGAMCNVAGISGTVMATVLGPTAFDQISTNGVAIGNTVTWDIADFALIDYQNQFWLKMLTDQSAQSGQSICITVNISLNSVPDINPLNNSLTQCFSVLNSYDPNAKEVYPKIVQDPGGWHTYTVHFQNTGTAAAQHILVKDTLDQNLDWDSFQLLAYSHDNLTQVLQDGIVHFNFPNINLPDSNSNEPDSHGWIQYKIKTDSTITPGTVIHNTAAIYFDFNDPVITNHALVTYCTPVETQQTLDICEGDSIQVGSNWYQQEGTYTNAFTNQFGCDSIVSTTVSFLPVYPGIMSSANVLTASGGVSYQWIDCNTNQIIIGATSDTFIATQNGLYAAQVTDDNGCSGTTECLNVTVDGVALLHQGVVNVFPNPSPGDVHFDFGGLRGVLAINNVLGQNVQRIDVNASEIIVTGLPQGLFTFEFVATDGTPHRGKLVIQK